MSVWPKRMQEAVKGTQMSFCAVAFFFFEFLPSHPRGSDRRNNSGFVRRSFRGPSNVPRRARRSCESELGGAPGGGGVTKGPHPPMTQRGKQLPLLAQLGPHSAASGGTERREKAESKLNWTRPSGGQDGK